MRDMSGDSISTASSINARLADAASKEFFWGCELSKDKPSVQWNFEEEDNDQDFLQHTLFLRHAILGKAVAKDEKHIVEIETKNFAGDDVKQPILALTGGKSDMCQLDLNFGHEIPVTFRLIEGNGPVFLSAQQLVEFPQEIEEDEFLTATETETECTEEEEEEEADSEDMEDVKGKKRKANGASGSKKKRGKLDSEGTSNGTESDEDADEEKEDDEDEDDDDDQEELMETSEEEPESEDEDEDEEEEEYNPKKKSKGKKGKAPAASAKVTKKPKAKPKAKKPAKKGKAK